MGEFAIGQSVSRFEDPRLLRGGGRYLDDVQLPGMARGVVVRSPHAHARIRKIDTARAKAAPGVLAVLTGADWQASGWTDLPVPGGLKNRDGSVAFKPGYPALAKDRVRFVGDYVAFVVAETLHQALDAAELVDVDYETLPAVTNTEKATQKGAPSVWEGCKDNLGFWHSAGDKAKCDAAFAKADHVVKHRFDINRVHAATMEPRGAVGIYDAADARYTVHTPVQRGHGFRADLAAMIKVPESKVRVIAGDIGGSFGMKSAVYNEVALAMLAAKLTGRPVKWMATRSEAFLCDAHARDNVTEAELALDKDGKFLALRVKTLAAIGAYLQTGMPAFFGNVGTLAGVYVIPAAYADVTAVYSHTPPVRPYRGNGRPEAAYVIERMVDLAADELGIDPAEIRRRNCIPPEQLPYKTALTFTYDSGAFAHGMEQALKMADVAGFAKRRAETKKRGKLRGLGISNSIERAAAGGIEGVEIRFDRAGTVSLFAGSVNHGQGHETIFKQIVCDALGLSPADVQYIQGDTDLVWFGEGTGGSRSATIGGSAFLGASEKIVDKAKKIAAHLLEASAADIEFANGKFTIAGTDRAIGLKQVAKEAANPDKLPKDMEAGLAATSVYNAPVQNFPNGTHVVEVEIDPDTGTTEIVRYSVVDDVGTVINPLLLKGQIVGGVAQGVGQILMEDIHFDGSGQLVTGSFMDYAMPRADNLSYVEVKSNAVPTKTNPLGVKGAGEAGCVGAMPAVANAIVDALSDYGVRHIAMPATPEVVWRAINGMGG